MSRNFVLLNKGGFIVVKKEFHRTREDGVNLYRTYSDLGLKIRKVVQKPNGELVKTNKICLSSIDVENIAYFFEEVDKK